MCFWVGLVCFVERDIVSVSSVVDLGILILLAFVLLVLIVHLDLDLKAIEPAVVHVLDSCLGVFLLTEINHGMSIDFRLVLLGVRLPDSE